MPSALPADTRVAARDADLGAMRAAFRELHGRRLAGFATMLLLGNGQRAAELAAASLARGSERVTELRHPERAAAWLRADLLRHVGRVPQALPPALDPVLAALGATPAIMQALATLDLRQRAVIIAMDIEHLDLRDVERIVGRRPAATARLLAQARTRFAASFDELGARHGEIAKAVEAAAGKAGDFGGMGQ
jgi:DNA-directed RNA polymerase specialized sigma24 family protein